MSKTVGSFPDFSRKLAQEIGQVSIYCKGIWTASWECWKKVGQYHGQKEKKLISGKRQALPDFQRQLKSVFPYALSYADFLFYALNQPK